MKQNQMRRVRFLFERNEFNRKIIEKKEATDAYYRKRDSELRKLQRKNDSDAYRARQKRLKLVESGYY